MARRNRSSAFEDIIEIVAKLPWWFGVLLALICYLWLHHVASQPVSAAPTDIKQIGSNVVGQIWRTIATFLQYIIPASCLIGAGISAYKKNVNGSAHSVKLESDGWTSHARSIPSCPQCGAQMVKRTAKKGNRAGETFWGCSSYPACKGIRTSA